MTFIQLLEKKYFNRHQIFFFIRQISIRHEKFKIYSFVTVFRNNIKFFVCTTDSVVKKYSVSLRQCYFHLTQIFCSTELTCCQNMIFENLIYFLMAIYQLKVIQAGKFRRSDNFL